VLFFVFFATFCLFFFVASHLEIYFCLFFVASPLEFYLPTPLASSAQYDAYKKMIIYSDLNCINVKSNLRNQILTCTVRTNT